MRWANLFRASGAGLARERLSVHAADLAPLCRLGHLKVAATQIEEWPGTDGGPYKS